jgi:CheY-like chemotaxis protein
MSRLLGQLKKVLICSACILSVTGCRLAPAASRTATLSAKNPFFGTERFRLRELSQKHRRRSFVKRKSDCYNSFMADTKVILLIEDEPLLSNLLRQRFERENFKVIVAEDGEKALAILKNTKPDLILLDIILPKMSGFELMEKLKDDPTLQSAPIVIVSNLGQESDIERGEMLGAIGYFVKAKLSIEDLVHQVTSFLQGSSS